jgi:hypothetical protein
MANLDGKSESSGLGHIYELEVHLESMEATNEKLRKTSKDLKTTTYVLVKGQECMSNMMVELLQYIKKSNNTQVGGSNSKAMDTKN